MIGATLGHFRVEQKLGAGGMGEVYLARDLRLDRRVALKFIHPALAADPDIRRRFVREAQALAALDHPNVGAVYGVEEVDGRLFMVLAYIEGRPLEALLADGPLPPARARALLVRIAEGLSAAHRQGIVHRDIKSGNIMVGADDVPRLVDFGIAARGHDTRLTRTGAYLGTPGLTAPEVFRGEPADMRSDVFSLGVVAYQALTGVLPFERANPAASMHAVLNEAPPPFPAGLPEETRALEPVVLRCLDKDPAQRPADAGAVATALRSGHADAPTPAAAARHRPAVHARPWWPAAAALAVIAVAAAAWLALRHRTPAGTPSGGAERRSVAVLEFENVTGDPSLEWMGRGVAELLGAALVQSEQLDVFDSQRLGELSAGENAKATPGAPGSMAMLARHGIRRAITGTILRSGGDLRIQGKILDTEGGRLVHSYAVEGPADSGLFHLVGRLIPDLQVALEVNLSGNREAEAWLQDITTTSADAYRAYLRGHEALLASRWSEAAAAFEQALALDSTFVAARTELSGAYWNLGDGPKLQVTRAAMQRMRGHTDHRGQLRIDLLEAVVGNDPPGLVRAASELVRIYPENRFYTYLLGRGYFSTRQYRRCLDTLRPLMEQRYGWAWTYVLSAHSAEKLGDFATARRAYALGFEVTNADPELAYVYARFLRERGNLADARAVVEKGLRSPTLAETPVGEGELRFERAVHLVARRDTAAARQELQKVAALLPRDDEAWLPADTLMRQLGIRQ